MTRGTTQTTFPLGRAALFQSSAVALFALFASCSAPTIPGQARDWTGFHGDRAKLGWIADEVILTPARVASGDLRERFRTDPFDTLDAGGARHRGFAYASPLYVDRLQVSSGALVGKTLPVVIVATSNADVYALTAFPSEGVPEGTIVWKTRLSTATPVPKLDGGVPLGILSTPVLDPTTSPPTLYVSSMDAARGWQVFALDAATGAVRPGWPVDLDAKALAPVNRNGPAAVQPAVELSQRAALVLNQDGTRLYVGIGSFAFASVGWLIGIHTRNPRVESAFSVAPTDAVDSNGGIWGAGGPALDERGNVYVATGNSPKESGPAPRTWGNSLLRFAPDLTLLGTYTPFNYCMLDRNNIDLGGSAPLLLPRPAGATDGPLVTFGGKQGTVYLLSTDRLAGRDRRPPCETDASHDASLLPPEIPGIARRGPLNVFGPYSEVFGQIDNARMRSRPAYFRDDQGAESVFVTGSTKATEESTVSVPPGVARLRIVRNGAAGSYLRVDALARSVAFTNPGSPVVSSDGGSRAVVWVLDQTSPRSARFVDPATPGPILYGLDASTLAVIFKSGVLPLGGKYATPVVVRGRVFVATDRLIAFGVRP